MSTAPLSPAERQLARQRISRWPEPDRRELVKLTAPEVETIGLLVALLDLRPLHPPVKNAVACGTMTPVTEQAYR